MKVRFHFAWLLAAIALLLPFPARGQNTTTVTATITDPNGIPYSYATVSAQLVPTGITPTINGQAVVAFNRATADVTGAFSMNLASNAALSPGGTQWQFTINETGIAPPFGTGPQQIVATITISGATQSISATLNALAGKLTNFSGAGTGTIGGAIVAGQTAYGSGANAIAGGTVVLDMAGIAGADLGAKMNNCASALPAAGGTCKGDNLAGAQTLSTAVTTAKPVTYTFSGQAISQSAAITLANANSGIDACAGTPPTFTKAGNIDQFTLSATGVFVRCLVLAGAKGSFTGNGIVTATGASNAQIQKNTISAEANDDIKDSSATSSVNNISGNWLFSWGLHAYENTSSSQLSLLEGNYILGDGTATGSAIINPGSASIVANFVKDSNGVLLVDDSTAVQGHPVSGNRFNQTNGWPSLKTGPQTQAVGNQLFGGGANGPAVIAQSGSLNANLVNVTNADGIDSTSGQTQIVGNIVNLTVSSANSNLCDINVINDNLLNVIADNFVQIGDTNNGDKNYGICLTAPLAGHMLENSVHDNIFNGVLSGAALADGYYWNNTNALGNNQGENSWVNNKCIHENPACLLRVDSTNAINTFEEIENDTGTIYDGTGGSTRDVLIERMATLTSAQLPNAGDGSTVNCSNCTMPGLQDRLNGVWMPKLPTGNAICAQQGPLSAITGTGSGATYFTCTIPASILGTGGGVELTAVVKHTNGSASVTYTLNFGGTNTTGIGPAGSANQIEVLVYRIKNNAGSASAQTITSVGQDSNQGTNSIHLDLAAVSTGSAVTVSLQFNVAAPDQITPELFYAEPIF